MSSEIAHVWKANYQVYGVVKVWRQLKRDGHTVERCTVERLMRSLGLRGVKRGKAVRTTYAESYLIYPPKLIARSHPAYQFSHSQTWIAAHFDRRV